MSTTVARTSIAPWPYAGEESPQYVAWLKNYQTIERTLASAKARLTALPKPAPVAADNAVVNINTKTRWGRVDGDARKAEAVVKQTGEVSLYENRLEYLNKRRPVPFTREELEAARVVRTELGWEPVIRVNDLSVTVGKQLTQTRIGLEKVLEVRA
jgi:hypothetical protein